MINLSNPISISPAVASANPWSSVMPDLADGPETAAPADQFELSHSPFLNTGNLGETPACSPSSCPCEKLAAAGLSTALDATPGLHPGLKVLLLGAESSAKEEFAQQLSSQHNLPHLHMGDLITAEVDSKSELGKSLAESKARGDNSPGELINQLLEKRLSGESEGFILDAYPTDLARTDLKTLLGNKQEVKVVELTAGETCPCIPALQKADSEGHYFQIDDKRDKESIGTELNALMENFLTPDMGWLKK